MMFLKYLTIQSSKPIENSNRKKVYGSKNWLNKILLHSLYKQSKTQIQKLSYTTQQQKIQIEEKEQEIEELENKLTAQKDMVKKMQEKIQFQQKKIEEKDQKIQELEHKIKSMTTIEKENIFLNQLRDDYMCQYEELFNLIPEKQHLEVNNDISSIIFYSQQVYNRRKKEFLLANMYCDQEEKTKIKSLLQKHAHIAKDIQIARVFQKYIANTSEDLTCNTELDQTIHKQLKLMLHNEKKYKKKQEIIYNQLKPFINEKIQVYSKYI